MNRRREAPPIPLWIIYTSCALILSGVQVVLPSLPAIQDRLGLGNAEVSLLITMYVVPSVLAAVPLSVAADRVGRRPILVAALAGFGLGGVYLLFRHSFVDLLAVRALQGICFAPVIPLGITLIGDHLSGPVQVAAQGKRVMSMNAANAALPVAGGALAALTWWAPFAIQALTLPLAMAAFRLLPADPARPQRAGVSSILRNTMERPLLPIHATAFLRFFLRYGLLTYLPILLAQQLNLTAYPIGLVLGAAAMAGTLGAAVTSRLSVRRSPAMLLAGGLAGISAGFLGIAATGWLPAVVGAVIVYGFADGVFTVVHASVLTESVPATVRASMVGVTGGMKNLGQAIGPSAMALLALVAPLGAAFAAFGGVSLLSVGVTRLVRLNPGNQATPIDPLDNHEVSD